MHYTQVIAINSDIHAVQHAAQAERPLIRFIWILLLLLSLIYPIYEAVIMIQRMQAKQTTANLFIINQPRLRFPAVTICNLNAYKKSAVYRLPQLKTLLEAYEASLEHAKNKGGDSSTTTSATIMQMPNQEPPLEKTEIVDQPNQSRKKRANANWLGSYWLGGYVKSSSNNGVWVPSNTTIDSAFPLNKDSCSCDSQLAVDLNLDSTPCDYNLTCDRGTGGGGQKMVCVTSTYKLRCADPNEQMIPLCRIEAADNCNQKCPLVSGMVYFLYHNSACYYVKNCDNCTHSYADAQKFCSQYSYNGKTASLASDFAASDMSQWILYLLKAHYNGNLAASATKCYSPIGDVTCCDGMTTQRHFFFAYDTELDIMPNPIYASCSGPTWKLPAIAEGTKAPWNDLCGMPTTTVPTTTTTTTTTTPVTTTASTTEAVTTTTPSTTVATTEPETTTTPITTVTTTVPTTTTTVTTTTVTKTTMATTTLKPYAAQLFNITDVISFLNLQNMSGEPLAMQTTIAEAVPFVVGAITQDQRMDLGYQLDEIVAKCTFQGQPCDIERDFQKGHDVVLGNCYTFNGNNYSEPLYSDRAGEGNGLRIMLENSQKEYLPTMTTAGLAIFIHDRDDLLVGNQDAGSVPPGYMVSFEISYALFFEITTTRLPPPSGKPCGSGIPNIGFYYATQYSQDACFRSCYQTQAMKNCSCADPKYPYPPEVSVCNLAERSCIDAFALAYAKTNGDDSCDCPFPCDVKEYQWTGTLSRVTPNTICLDSNETTNCVVYTEKNLSFANVYYQNLEYTKIVEELNFGSDDLWRELSNTIGFWLGCSCVAVVEIAVILIMPCVEERKKISTIGKWIGERGHHHQGHVDATDTFKAHADTFKTHWPRGHVQPYVQRY